MTVDKDSLTTPREKPTHPESYGHWDCWQISELLYQRDALAEALRTFIVMDDKANSSDIADGEIDAALDTARALLAALDRARAVIGGGA